MAGELTLEDLHNMAARAGLKLTDDELQKLLPGVSRARKQVTELQQLIAEATEPASIFSALKADKV